MPSNASRPRQENGRDAFGSCHPTLCFGFFAGALVAGMCLRHPVYQAIGLACALLYYFLLRGRAGVRLLAWIVPLGALATFINPLFDPLGNTILFTWAGGRPYTLEALYAGLSAGVMLATVLTWFGCYNAVMTSDKFRYLFGHLSPSASLVLTMIMRFVPLFQTKMGAIAAACRGIGMAGGARAKRERLRQGGWVLAALSGWALERSVEVADSMRARGFGLTGRTAYGCYRLTQRDAVLLIVFLALAVILIASLAAGTAAVDFLPAFRAAPVGPASIIGYASYAALLAAPSAIDIREAVVWRNSLSRI